MTPSVLCAQLYAIRAHVDALILAMESEAGVPAAGREPGSCPECGADPDKVKDESTLDGTKRSRCTECRHEWIRVPGQV